MIEQLKSSANQAIDALKGSPILLTLVLLQFALLGGVIWLSSQRSNYEHKQFELLLAQCGPHV
jgi:hypothetical protein